MKLRLRTYKNLIHFVFNWSLYWPNTFRFCDWISRIFLQNMSLYYAHTRI